VRGQVGAALNYLRENLGDYRPGMRLADRPLLILALTQSAGLPLDSRDGTSLDTDSSPDGLAVAAIWHSAIRDTSEAQGLLQHLRAQPSDDRRGLEPALTLAEAWIAASCGRWPDVQRVLGPVAVQGAFVEPRINLLSRWLVAEANERTGALDSAAAMFERIASWQGFAVGEPRMRGLAESFAHRRLVMLYARMGRLDDARRHWKVFSETFTQPDPEVAHLIDEARSALEAAEARAKGRPDEGAVTGPGVQRKTGLSLIP
jgi:hypothetical protein